MAMRPMALRPAQRKAALAAVLGLGGLGFLPLFGGPGYEAALAAGVVLPAASAVATAVDVVEEGPSPLDAFSRGCMTGAGLGALGLLVTLLHGLRAGFCDAWEGVTLFALGPWCGAVAGGAFGAAAGLVAARGVAKRPRLLGAALAVVGPVLGIVVSLVRFYTSPMVFAFDPFFGFFAGTLYDSVITGMGRLLTYRAGTLATLIAAGALARTFDREGSGRLVFSPRGRGSALLLAALGAAASVFHTMRGPALGHYQTAATIREALGASTSYGRCDLSYPTGTPAVEARALVRECDGHLRQLERFFGVSGPERVRVFLFASADQKGALMGAAGTYIAKPWRAEVYVQRSGYPHPVLRHELAHVVAGAFGRGPFRVSGPLRGIVPDPGRIEGVAVAAAPRDEELSLDEWARAMKELRLLPPLERVFKLSFLGEPSSRAYVVAGSFIDWLRRTKGIEVVRLWYGGDSLEASAGEPLPALERSWLGAIERLPVSDDVLAAARARFDQPAIFGRKCPHVVDRLAQEAGAALGSFDTERARHLYETLLALDPHDLGGRFGLATCDEREGHTDAARAAYDRIAREDALGRAVQARANEWLGDRALAAGDGAEARRRYDEVARAVVDPDRLRTLDVKRFATTFDAEGRAALVAHLFGDPRLGRDAALAAASLGAWSSRSPELGLPDYLLARTYAGSSRFDLVADSLDRALAKGLPVPSVVREAYRMRVVAACALGDAPRATTYFERWWKTDGPRAPERAEFRDFLERCTGSRPPLVEAPSGQAPPARPPDRTVSPAGTALLVACPEGMVKIPESETWIGSPRGDGIDDEWPRYRTRLPSYCIDVTEVTVGAYAACVARGGCTPADHERVTCTARGHGDDYPINCVDWKQASAYCASRASRLPTEAEWEHAATAGDERLYSWGSDPPDGRTCWKTNGACRIRSFPAGAFGLYDMTGNVWEWTSDAYGDYPWPSVDSFTKVYRGGSWSRRFEKWMRARLRNRGEPGLRGSHLGFRCAATLRSSPCPFGEGAGGTCLRGVLDAECREGKRWNGVRCAPPGEAGCGEGRHELPGLGCVREVPVEDTPVPAADLSSVTRKRAPEFDPDCGRFQASRPQAYRFEGGSHEARNQVERSLGCKNRDVGVGWNSACCP